MQMRHVRELPDVASGAYVAIKQVSGLCEEITRTPRPRRDRQRASCPNRRTGKLYSATRVGAGVFRRCRGELAKAKFQAHDTRRRECIKCCPTRRPWPGLWRL